VKRAMVALIVTGAAWMGLAKEAQAQVLITPTGPLSIRTRAADEALVLSGSTSTSVKFYPGRTMGGGSRIFRPNPPPSSLKRRKE